MPADTIVESKNGTGKTLAFVVPTLMRLRPEHDRLQCVVLAPTREIAVQIQQCFRKVGRRFPPSKKYRQIFVILVPVVRRALSVSPWRHDHLSSDLAAATFTFFDCALLFLATFRSSVFCTRFGLIFPSHLRSTSCSVISTEAISSPLVTYLGLGYLCVHNICHL